MKVKATYVSVWDDGIEVRTSCLFDPENGTVAHIEATDDVEGLDILIEEYVELPSGKIFKDFVDEDNGRFIVNGQIEE